jgi:hypothetical protein
MDLELLRRNSRIKLDARGRFLHEGSPVTHPHIEALFRRGLRVRDDGEVTLHVGAQWCYVEVEDVPFFVQRVRLLGNPASPDSLEAELTSGERLALDPASIVAVGADALYAPVGPGGLPARLLRGAHHALAPLLVEMGQGFGLRMATGDVPIGSAEASPVWRTSSAS